MAVPINKKLKNILFVYKLLSSLKRMFWICVGLFVFQAAWEVVVLTSMAAFLNSVINSPVSSAPAAASGSYLDTVFSFFNKIPEEQRPLVGFLISTGSLLLKSLMDIGIMTYRTRFSTLFIWQVRNQTFDRLSHCGMSFFDNQRKGALIQMVINETRSCYSLLKVSLDLITSALRTAVYCGMMFLISWQFSLVITLVAILFILENYFVGRALKRLSAVTVDKNRKVTVSADEGIGGIKQIKLLQYYKKVQGEFSKAGWESDSASRKCGLLIEWQRVLSRLIALATFFVFMFINAKFNLLPIASLLVFLYLMASLMTSLTAVNQKYGFLNISLPAVENIRKFFNQSDDDKERSGELIKEQLLQDKISFRNVYLNYGKDMVLEDISLDIPKGIKIALVGESGAGKTSLVNMLPLLYRVKKGNILIDGIDINQYNLNFLRSKFAVVSQDIMIFNKTIRENLLMARPDASHAQLETAAKSAFAHEFIMELSDKYDTVVGDRGVKLSGGQRQRIAIAQTFLRDTEVLIFDEATSALDTRAEQHIQKAIEALEENKTSIIIAHRLSTLKNVDLIVVLDKGKIVEQGTWAKLYGKQGAFHDMVKRQSFAM